MLLHQLDKRLKLAPFNRLQWVCDGGGEGKEREKADSYTRAKVSEYLERLRKEKTKTELTSFIPIAFVERNSVS